MAIHINRVYTRSGDSGKTSLVGNVRVDKDCQKLESCGTVDELNCLVGEVRTAITEKGGGLDESVRQDFEALLRTVQNRLFDLGSILATPAGHRYAGMPKITDHDADELEREMDRMQESLEPLNSFCLPGGTAPNALLHHCRAVCRRAEREILRLAREEEVDKRLLKYVNRLSDLFFVMARYAAKKAGAPEYLWEFGTGSVGEESSEATPEGAALKDPV